MLQLHRAVGRGQSTTKQQHDTRLDFGQSMSEQMPPHCVSNAHFKPRRTIELFPSFQTLSACELRRRNKTTRQKQHASSAGPR